ncbi:recombinase family protein [Arthrobacter sp. ES3-54]|uniref:recombinase family protein n=1 Tax=Arthrobacter sp. ES3-54 TaxID=1502991 RepID=UPI002404E8CA|nr:recombinase family protein [Arthrobacter sp. ES3-54]
MRAAIYLRQSLDAQEGIDRQRQRTSSIATARGYQIVKTYEDNASSATRSRVASQWGQLLADASNKEFEIVIAVDVDRLLRSITDLSELIKTGVKVLTVDGEIDLTTADGEFRASMLAAIARFEVRRKSERQKRANEARAKRGKRVGGRRAFGYEPDGVTVREPEAEALRKGYGMVAGQESVSAVARYWNGLGFTTGQNRRLSKEDKIAGKKPTPSQWTRSAVRDVLLNERNVGRMVYLGEVQAVAAEWRPVVDDDLFETVRSILLNPERQKPGRNPVGLLTGIALCGVCEGTVHAGGSARSGYRGYRCSGSTGHFARLAEPVEEYVHGIMVSRLADRDAKTLLQPSTSTGARQLRGEQGRLRERLEALAVEFADSDDDDAPLAVSQLKTATKRINERLTAIQAELADAGRIDLLGGLVNLGGSTTQEREAAVRDAWHKMPGERQRAVIRELLHIKLHPPGRGTRNFRPSTVAITWL